MRALAGSPLVPGIGLFASGLAVIAAAAPAAADSTPLAIVRRLVGSLAAAPPAARLSLPVEHEMLAGAVGAFLLTALGLETSTRLRRARRRGRAVRAAGTAILDVASAAGTRTLHLERAHAHAIEDGEGRLVAQVVWSHELGWCAQASWPHSLYGPEGLPRLTAALPEGVWLHVAGVGLRLRSGAPLTAEEHDGRPFAHAL
jgi:hypothetical protein